MDVPAALCERWAPGGSTQERAPPLGNQPENWWTPAVFFNTAGTPEQASKELHMGVGVVGTSSSVARLCLRPIFIHSLSFSSLVAFVPLLPQMPPLASAYLSLRHIWADYSWAPTWAGFRRRLPGPWPAAWTRGVGLNCQLKLSCVFSFVESGCVDDDRPSYPRVKEMCTDADGMDCVCSRGTLVVLLSTVSRNVRVCLPGCRVVLS